MKKILMLLIFIFFNRAAAGDELLYSIGKSKLYLSSNSHLYLIDDYGDKKQFKGKANIDAFRSASYNISAIDFVLFISYSGGSACPGGFYQAINLINQTLTEIETYNCQEEGHKITYIGGFGGDGKVKIIVESKRSKQKHTYEFQSY